MTAYRIEPFVYKDGLGTCGKIAATECEANRPCATPEPEIVPCP